MKSVKSSGHLSPTLTLTWADTSSHGARLGGTDRLSSKTGEKWVNMKVARLQRVTRLGTGFSMAIKVLYEGIMK